MATRILLADDHTLMRQGLRQILEQNGNFEVIAEANSGLEAVEMAEKHHPDVAIIDIAMKELNGIEATAQILKHSPHTVILILSMYSDERYVIRAIKAGARGYVLKNSAGDELVRAIQQVQRGNAFFSPAVARVFQEGHGRLSDVRDANDRYELLTERERQIYQLLAEGNSNKDIANRLNLSLHTIETHRWRVMEKLDLHSTAELVLSAVRRGLVT
jgi:two-component system, NarL family, response regulator NreC